MLDGDVLTEELTAFARPAAATVSRSASLSEAAAALRAAGATAALVTEHPRTLLRASSLLEGIARGMGPRDGIAELIDPAPMWITTTSSVHDALLMMLHHNVVDLVVLDKTTDSMMGLVSFVDLTCAAVGHDVRAGVGQDRLRLRADEPQV